MDEGSDHYSCVRSYSVNGNIPECRKLRVVETPVMILVRLTDQGLHLGGRAAPRQHDRLRFVQIHEPVSVHVELNERRYDLLSPAIHATN